MRWNFVCECVKVEDIGEDMMLDKLEVSHEFTDAKAEDILHDKDANSLN